MEQVARQANSDRLKASLGAAAFHALLGYALITGLGLHVEREVGGTLKTFDISLDPVPPPLEESAPAEATREAEGAAAPPNLKGKPAPVVVPPPKIKLDVRSRVATADRRGPVQGSERTAGASDVAGPGTGSGGQGTGSGNGNQGSGAGGGGIASRARRERGGFSESDYRRLAKGTPLSATVHVRYTVGPDGVVSGCTVTKSSGRADVDATTCRLIEQRFRYRPAMDGQGRPVAEVVNSAWSWEPR